MVAIITAIYGDYDDLKPTVAQDVEVDWVCVTDRERESRGWRLLIEPKPHLSPRLASKIPRCLPWEFAPGPESIWLDASFRVLSPTFAREAMVLANPIAQFAHTLRQCIYDEAKACLTLSRCAGEPIAQQIDCYKKQGHPDGWGLWATGVIARRHTPEVRDFGEAWLAQLVRWSTRCQISEAPCLRRCGLRPAAFPGSFSCGWMQYEPSDSHDVSPVHWKP